MPSRAHALHKLVDIAGGFKTSEGDRRAVLRKCRCRDFNGLVFLINGVVNTYAD